MAEEVIGSGFSDNVRDQFKARENLFNSKSRTNDQLLYMNSNGAWARLVSSVNTLPADEVKKLAAFEVGPKDIKGSRNLAYNNVLLGGTKKQAVSNESNYNLKGGVDFTKGFNPVIVEGNQTIQAGDLRTSQYNNYNSLGFRPTPGIESVSIESKNTYGTLREAKVKIVAWTLEDLEVIQALYLRPGYSMLLEWGHSMFIENDGRLNKNGVDRLYNDFLDSPKTGREIERDLVKKRDDNFNNYDAMYGVVKNFNWKFRQDGGYDCEVTLVSKGSVLESMSILFDASQTLNTEIEENSTKKQKETNTHERKSPFNKFFSDLAKIKKEEFSKKELVAREVTQEGNYELLEDFDAFRIDLDTSKDLDELEDRGQFINLRTLLDFYNKYVAPVDKVNDDLLDGGNYKILKYYTGQGESQGPYRKSLKYITTDSHFSIDPVKCLLPKEFKAPEDFTEVIYKTTYTQGVETEDGETVGGTTARREAVGTKKVLDLGQINELKKTVQKKIKKGTSNDILNIFISNHFLSTTLNSIQNSEDKTQQNMYTFVKRILDSMNDVLGGVNDFDQFYDESDDLWYIVDRKVTPLKETHQKHVKLNLTGLQSTITDLSISSKISNEIGAQVAIAAQGVGNNYKENVGALLKWNSGVIDRTIPTKTITQKEFDEQNEASNERLKQEVEKHKEWAKDTTSVFEEYNTKGNIFNYDVDYDEQKHSELSPGHKQYCSKWVEDFYSKNSDEPKPQPGVIPIELSFKTVGIGGLKIGQAFKIAPGILPKVYDENFGYIITGLSHDISANKWETSIKTQFYSIAQPFTEELVKNIKPREFIPIGPFPAPPLPDSDPALDPAPRINTEKRGTLSYDASPLARKLKNELNQNGLLDLKNLEPIGETLGAQKYYINPKTGKPEYMLHPIAAQAWYKWRDEMIAQNINYSISSAYRNSEHQSGLPTIVAASPGTSAHGWAGALDFRNLYRIVNGSTNLRQNLNGRIQSPEYEKMATLGKKYGWFNPWRLSDNSGNIDEMWHFEYWGEV